MEIGDKNGRLTIINIEVTRPIWRGKAIYVKILTVKCDCGNIKAIKATTFKPSGSISCGCYKKEMIANVGRSCKTHGLGRTRIHATWRNMRQRCSNPSDKSYPHYGGRGIRVCSEWESFDVFLFDMGARPAKMSLDRIDVNGDYCKENCRWATTIEQANNKRTTRMLSYKGKQRTIVEIAQMELLSSKRLREAVYRGYDVEKAIARVRKKHGSTISIQDT